MAGDRFIVEGELVEIDGEEIGIGSYGKNEADEISQPYLEGDHWMKIGQIGSMSFKVQDTKTSTMYAVKQIKFYNNIESEEKKVLHTLMEEVAILKGIHHPNLVHCFGATQYQEHINIFMEWMAGGSLDNKLEELGKFNEDVVSNYTKQIVQGIVFLHKVHGVIHRALKGSNILFDYSGKLLKIAEFGSSARCSATYSAHEEFNKMKGTVSYLAPENIQGNCTDDCRCDVWSLGCAILHMLTAQLPWEGTYDPDQEGFCQQLLFKIGTTNSPPPMPQLENQVLQDFMKQCLQLKLKNRPDSIDLLSHPLFSVGILDTHS